MLKMCRVNFRNMDSHPVYHSVYCLLIYLKVYCFCCRCATGMAEKLREAAARGDVARVTRLLDENVKPLPDEV